MTTHAPRSNDNEIRPEVFDDYRSFVKEAIREYYELGWKNRRGNFIALLIASGQAMSLAADSVKDGSGIKKAAFGAAGFLALRVGLRYALSGPLGIVLTGAAAVSAVTYLVKNQKEIGTKVTIYRALVESTRTKFDEVQGGFRGGRYDAAARNLMVDGLLRRFLDEVDAA
ncbi:MAG TPA: hypothetical protein VGP07_19970 [Polyangia bacterium]|jgi:hypothetical protein